MHLSVEERRRAISRWLRTGFLPVARLAGGLELKFNPYHDPRNGRFTFATGIGAGIEEHYGGQGPRLGRGGNSRAFEDPMTVEQAFPELHGPLWNGIQALAQSTLDIFGPAAEAQINILDNRSKEVLKEIKKLDPNFVYQQIYSPQPSVEASAAKLDDLMMWRAATYLRKTGNIEPLKTAMMVRMQREIDQAKREGDKLQKAGELKSHGVNDQMRLGNYVDRRVRGNIRGALNWYGIKAAARGRVRINRRLYIDGQGRSYGIPDVMVDDLIIEGSLQRKTMSAAQLRRFAKGLPKPRHIAVMTPSEAGSAHTYVYKIP